MVIGRGYTSSRSVSGFVVGVPTVCCLEGVVEVEEGARTAGLAGATGFFGAGFGLC